MFMDLGTDQNLAWSGSSAVALSTVDRIAYDCEFHAIGGANQAVDSFATMNIQMLAELTCRSPHSIGTPIHLRCP